MSKRLFLSDVHIGAGREGVDRSTYPHDWYWLSDDEQQSFVAFVNHLHRERRGELREVVILGDLFDTWLYPHDADPPRVTDLLDATCNRDVVAALRQLSEAPDMRVLFVPGNHDMHATREVMAAVFPRIIYCPNQFIAGRLVAEHGHRYTLCNASPSFTRNIMGLPFAYFLARIESTRRARTGYAGRSYLSYLDDALEVGGRQTLSQCVLEAALEEAELDEDITFSLRKRDGTVSRTVTAAEVKETYKDLYDDWSETIVSRPRAVFAELGFLKPVADRLCRHGKRKVCVLGHSHKVALERDGWFGADCIYANPGCWCCGDSTFVEVHKDETGKHTVKLGAWKQDRIEYTAQKEVA